VVERRPARGEPRVRLSLYQALLKANRIEFVLQKATELGAAEFIPLITERTVVSDVGAIRKKRRRWERIIREAAEQSGRGRLPDLRDPISFAGACAHAQQRGGLFAMPWEEARLSGGVDFKTLFRGADVSTVHLFIGPEGGFTQAEATLAREHGIPWVTLGSRVLRAETAALAAVVIVLHEADDLA
jgi:16S rRNA (uracil1498-N3)-methyltransferase